jgi:hypothetical protein
LAARVCLILRVDLLRALPRHRLTPHTERIHLIGKAVIGGAVAALVLVVTNRGIACPPDRRAARSAGQAPLHRMRSIGGMRARSCDAESGASLLEEIGINLGFVHCLFDVADRARTGPQLVLQKGLRALESR